MRRFATAVLTLLLAAVLLAGCGAKDPYVASKSSTKYHTRSCPWSEQIKPEKLASFKTKAEAEAAGFKACPTCKP